MARKRYPTLHPACKLFPKLGRKELDELADDIKQNGLQNSIIVLDGKILDGQNRLAACKLAGVEPRFKEWKGRGSPIEWVISQNLMRRHLTASQRAVIGLDLLPMLEKEAKQRQRQSNNYRKNGRSAQKCADQDTGRASQVAARIVKSSSRYVEMAKSIGAKAPELIDIIRLGQMALSEANWIADLPKNDRKSLLKLANGDEIDDEIIREWKSKRKKRKSPSQKPNSNRIQSTTLMHGDCRKKLQEIPDNSVDAIISDPIYPEVNREYGRISESDWHDLMQEVVRQSMRVLKPKGSAVFILQPNFDKVGKMRLWLWEFMVWAAKEWNLVQDAYWWAIDSMPTAVTNRNHGLMRQSVKTCVWLGPPDCYRNQANVLWEASEVHKARTWSDRALQIHPSGQTVRDGRTAQTSSVRGGTVPFNLIPLPNVDTSAANGHPASTPKALADWWCRYILPTNGVLLDPFCGSCTMLAAGLDNGASEVIGIDKEKKYLKAAKKRVALAGCP